MLLNTEITSALRIEGFVRECIRTIQNIRKEVGLSLTEVIGEIHWHLPDEQRSNVQQYEEKIKREVRAEKIKYILTIPENGYKCTIDGVDMSILLLERPGKMF